MKRFVLLLVGMMMVCASVSAQSKLKRANKAFEDFNYQEAIEIYNQILDKDNIPEAVMNLAEAYRKVGNVTEAEYWFGEAVKLPESEPIHKLYYGMMLQTNGKCDLAREWFVKYVGEVPDDLRGQYLVKACDYEQELMDKNGGIYEMENMPFNTELDDFSPMFFGDGIVYASEYKTASGPIKSEHNWTGNPFLELFYVSRTTVDEDLFEYDYGTPDKFSGRLNSRFHDAVVSFSDDQNTIFFTRNNFVKGKAERDDEGAVRLKIFYATNEGGNSWSTLESLPFNSDEYSVAHPAISPDGEKLYFSSDMPGGFGGMDLYVSEKEGDSWAPPSNLGPTVNTEGNEVFPYIPKDGKKLYFASDGQVGLGGLDIYEMELKNDGTYGEIINVGYPINTKSDDFGIVMNEDNTFGYVSSDREGGLGGDDIYAFKKSAATIEIFVFDELTGEGIEGASVVNECTGNTLTTGMDGYVTLEQKLDICCNFAASYDGYLPNEKEGCTKNVLTGDKVIVEIPLKQPLEFNIEGIVFDEVTRLPIAGAIVELIPTDCADMETITATTNENGEYSFELAEKCCYEIRASKDPEYLANRSKEHCTKDLTKSTTIQQDIYLVPVVPEDIANGNRNGNGDDPNGGGHHFDGGDPNGGNPNGDGDNGDWSPDGGVAIKDGGNGFGTGRTDGTYLLHIYYDFDQSYIRADAEPELEKLLVLLKENPKYVVEIGSHTDSRGSHRYNDRLSQRRAEAVVRWLKEKDIPADRLRPQGYGENKNVNNCSNNVPCSEEEHQWNRRTEFRILGYYDDNGEYKNIQESARPSTVDVDHCQGCPF